MEKPTFRWAAAGGVVVLALLGGACGDGDDTKTVTATDYRFENLPKTVKAGTTLTLKNESDKELHEMVVSRLPDNERRSADELVKLPEDELGGLFQGPPALVLFDPPGDAEPIKALGDGKLTEKGRYLVICSIPTGADPAEFLKAAEAAQGGPPQVAGGPPHFTRGMYGEITVE
ncbi:MAG: hypothetical protein M3O23_05050 [Actinomycetota bacterium]|nr:hypothetical protein [Actinomycetota bacterium]